ncbi:MAG: preprotein translocase subunit SecE [Acidaminococcales bacterium]|nr:preprotein translocase subunit SecE [Acidaminococcales bacterium]
MSVQDNTANMHSISGVKKFLREVNIELKKVTWPTRQQLVAYTGVVVIAVMLVSVLIWIFDSVFALAFRIFLKS